VALDEHLRYVSTTALSGITLDDDERGPVTGDMTVRSLSSEEQMQWYLDFGGGSAGTFHMYEPPTVAIEIRSAGPRMLRDVRRERDGVVAGEREHGWVSPAGGFRRGFGVHAVVLPLTLS
jgi:hypothetical protein